MATKANTTMAREDANAAGGSFAPIAGNSTGTAFAPTADKNQKRRKKMNGFIYRLGTAIKDAGERATRLPVLKIFSGIIVRIGFAIRDIALKEAM
jgi:hypothetical protein